MAKENKISANEILADIFGGCYLPDARDTNIFGDYYEPPDKFSHGEWHRIAYIPKVDDSDGQSVVIYECRMPARFYKIEVVAGKNSIKEPLQGYSISTGSGDQVGKLIFQLAIAISQGMIGIHKDDKQTV